MTNDDRNKILTTSLRCLRLFVNIKSYERCRRRYWDYQAQPLSKFSGGGQIGAKLGVFCGYWKKNFGDDSCGYSVGKYFCFSTQQNFF